MIPSGYIASNSCGCSACDDGTGSHVIYIVVDAWGPPALDQAELARIAAELEAKKAAAEEAYIEFIEDPNPSVVITARRREICANRDQYRLQRPRRLPSSYG